MLVFGNECAQSYSKLIFDMDALHCNVLYCRLCEKCEKRRDGLDESLKFFKFMEDAEQEESWLMEKQTIARSPDVGIDLKDVLRHQQLHEVLKCRWMSCT